MNQISFMKFTLFFYNGFCKKIQGGFKFFEKIYGGQVFQNKWGVMMDQGRVQGPVITSKHLLSSHVCGGGGIGGHLPTDTGRQKNSGQVLPCPLPKLKTIF
tara:strand:- start:437 stop:739 length:303 start_codon:yes stop_codon:yes gene_type:complete